MSSLWTELATSPHSALPNHAPNLQQICYGFADSHQRDQMVGALLGFGFLISSTCIYIALGVDEHAEQAKLA